MFLPDNVGWNKLYSEQPIGGQENVDVIEGELAGLGRKNSPISNIVSVSSASTTDPEEIRLTW